MIEEKGKLVINEKDLIKSANDSMAFDDVSGGAEVKTWIDEMIEREALPPELRQGSNEEFCKKWGIGNSTYYYQSSKPENQDKIVGLAIRYAKKHTSEVLENLGVRAKSDNKATELFIKFLLQLAEKTDITSGGKKITAELSESAQKLIKEYEEKLREIKTNK